MMHSLLPLKSITDHFHKGEFSVTDNENEVLTSFCNFIKSMNKKEHHKVKLWHLDQLYENLKCPKGPREVLSSLITKVEMNFIPDNVF
jgi:hypothetical protein